MAPTRPSHNPTTETRDRIGPFSVRTWAYILALTCAGALAYDLLRMPVQVFDALEEMLAAQRSTSIVDTFWAAAYNAAYLRPLRIVQIKLIFDAAQGHYWLAFRGAHALTMVACLLLFTRALRVRTVADLCAAAFALTVVTGLHTFRSTVQEAFPINHFLEIAVMALVTLNLSQARPRFIVDAIALVTFAVAALTLESGLLVWVVAVSAWLLGMRGVSTRGVVAMTALLAGYFVLRFGVLAVGTPGLIERGSGFLFNVLEPVRARASIRRSAGGVLRLQRRVVGALGAGVGAAERRLRDHRRMAERSSDRRTRADVRQLAGHDRADRDRRGDLIRRYRATDASDRLILLFAVVLAANATLSYAYTKDDIMSVSGIFYGLAAYAAIRLLIGPSRVDTTARCGHADDRHPRDRNGVEHPQSRHSSRRTHLRVQDAQRLGQSAGKLETVGPVAGRCAQPAADHDASQRRAVDAGAQPALRAAMDRRGCGAIDVSRKLLLVAMIPAGLLALTRVVFLVLALWDVHPFWLWEPLNLAEAAALRDRGEVARLLAAGEDPNATYPCAVASCATIRCR